MTELVPVDEPVMLLNTLDLAVSTYTADEGVYEDYMCMRLGGRIHVDGTWLSGESVWMVAMPDMAIDLVIGLLTQYKDRKLRGEI